VLRPSKYYNKEIEKDSMFKEYIGDSVYVSLDFSGLIVLTTEDGIAATNVIYMDVAVFKNLLKWKAGVEKGLKAIKETGDKTDEGLVK
jgi:hypothetical protein